MLVYALIISIVLLAISILRYRKVFNPFSLEAYFTIFFLMLPQLLLVKTPADAEKYFYSDLVIITYVASIFIGTFINVNSFRIRPIENVNVINTFNIALYILLLIPLMPLLLSSGFSAKGFRHFYETAVFSKYASFFELSKLVLYFIIFFKLINQQKFTIGFFILFPLIFFYGSRFVILDGIIYLCVFLEQFKNVGVRKILITCLVGAFFIGLYSYFQLSSKYSINEHLVSYFDIYKNQTFVINKLMDGDLDYFYGEIYFSSFLKYIPRILWEDKPKEFGFAILNYAVFPESAAKGYMPSFGLGTLFADFGFVSIIAMGLFNGFIKNFFYRIFLRSKNNISFFLFVIPFSVIPNIFLLVFLTMDYLVRMIRNSPQESREALAK